MPKRFEELIAQGEGISIEFKECKDALPKNVFETLCAFLNRFGGDIFLGLKDDGTIIGVDKDKSKKMKADIRLRVFCFSERTKLFYRRCRTIKRTQSIV